MADKTPKNLAEVRAEFAFEVKQYRDNNDRVINERTVIFGTPPKDFTRFNLPGTMQEMTPIGPMQWAFNIPLPGATTPKEAFDLVEQEAPKALEKAQAELKKFVTEKMLEAQKQVQVATDLPPSLLGGDGKTLRLPGGPRGGLRGDPRDHRRKKCGH